MHFEITKSKNFLRQGAAPLQPRKQANWVGICPPSKLFLPTQ